MLALQYNLYIILLLLLGAKYTMTGENKMSKTKRI